MRFVNALIDDAAPPKARSALVHSDVSCPWPPQDTSSHLTAHCGKTSLCPQSQTSKGLTVRICCQDLLDVWIGLKSIYMYHCSLISPNLMLWLYQGMDLRVKQRVYGHGPSYHTRIQLTPIVINICAGKNFKLPIPLPSQFVFPPIVTPPTLWLLRHCDKASSWCVDRLVVLFPIVFSMLPRFLVLLLFSLFS